MKTSEKIELFMKKGVLISPEVLEEVDEEMAKEIVIREDILFVDRQLIKTLKAGKKQSRDVRIINSYSKESKKRTCEDFIKYFNTRYNALEKMLRKRQELQRLTSISRVLSKREREKVSIIGMVSSKSETKNNHLILEIEDPTDKIKVIISKEKEIYKEARDIVFDEVIGVTGASGDKVIFAENIIFPEVPLHRETKKCPKEVNAVFISDVEVGSKNFMKQEFEKFILWLNGEYGGEKQKEIASKVKYLFVVGDLVSGVGIYPGQEEELELSDIKQQYAMFEYYLKQIPSHINIILCSGNHDAGRITEPQLAPYKDFSEEIISSPNITLVSNPSLVRIEETEDFAGFDVLLYHGFSMPYIADNVESIRAAGGQKRADMIMEFYLKKRHLAPTHTSNLYIPDPDEDPLVIEIVPDFLATGHIHRTMVHNYRSVTLLNCSAWTTATDYQVKRGLTPEPGRVILANLNTRKVKIMNFFKRGKDEMQ